MTESLSILLQAVATGDIVLAKLAALNVCNDADNDIPLELIEYLEPDLAPKESFDLPPEVAGLIEYEDVSQTFNPNRYWVSDREKQLLSDIIDLNRGIYILRDAKIPYLNATLLYGASGVGKTQFGRYLAHQFKLPFVYVNLSNLSDPTLGGTGRNIRTIFEFVNTHSCLFMLDELDAIGANRGSYARGGSGDEMTRTTIALMQCLDIVRRDAIILAATNRVDMLDAAVKRRFSNIHEVQAFQPDELYAMTVSYLEDVKETGNLDIRWDENDIRKSCQIGTSQAQIINICNRAVVRAVMTDGIIQFAKESELTRQNAWY